LIFSCGWHITRDGKDIYSWKIKVLVNVVGRIARLARVVDLDDQVEACRRVFASDTQWTVVRGSDLEEGDSQGLPVWSRHVGDPILESNITRRVDYALFMWRPSRTTSSSTRPRRLSAVRRPLRSRMPPAHNLQRQQHDVGPHGRFFVSTVLDRDRAYQAADAPESRGDEVAHAPR